MSLPAGAEVGIDEGGLCIRAVVDGEITDAYYDLGGIPEEIEDGWKRSRATRMIKRHEKTN